MLRAPGPLTTLSNCFSPTARNLIQNDHSQINMFTFILKSGFSQTKMIFFFPTSCKLAPFVIGRTTPGTFFRIKEKCEGKREEERTANSCRQQPCTDR